MSVLPLVFKFVAYGVTILLALTCIATTGNSGIEDLLKKVLRRLSPNSDPANRTDEIIGLIKLLAVPAAILLAIVSVPPPVASLGYYRDFVTENFYLFLLVSEIFVIALFYSDRIRPYAVHIAIFLLIASCIIILLGVIPALSAVDMMFLVLLEIIVILIFLKAFRSVCFLALITCGLFGALQTKFGEIMVALIYETGARSEAPLPPPETVSPRPDTQPSPQGVAPEAGARPEVPALSPDTVSPRPETQPSPQGNVSEGRYLVHVSSQRSEADAIAAYRALSAKYVSVLGGRKAIIRKVDLGDKGIFYRALVGPLSMGESIQVCSALKGAGGNCLVQRN